jgi:hypothetical protein
MAKRKKQLAAPKKKETLDQVTADEAVTVLRLLLKKHPDLTKEVEALAKSVIGDVSIEDVADEVEDAVRALDLDDLNSRTGRHDHGYVEPSQAACDLVEEAVTPFIEDMKRRAEAGQDEAALTTCVGIVLGLYRLRDKDGDEFLGWAVDSPDEMAGDAVVTLRKTLRAAKTTRGARQTFPELPAIFRETAPEWIDVLERCWRRPS